MTMMSLVISQLVVVCSMNAIPSAVLPTPTEPVTSPGYVVVGGTTALVNDTITDTFEELADQIMNMPFSSLSYSNLTSFMDNIFKINNWTRFLHLSSDPDTPQIFNETLPNATAEKVKAITLHIARLILHLVGILMSQNDTEQHGASWATQLFRWDNDWNCTLPISSEATNVTVGLT